MTLQNVKITLRTDEIQNWQDINPILNNGELIIVNDNDNIKFKVGNGLSTFNELPYIGQKSITTDFMDALYAHAQKFSQGIRNEISTISFVAGTFLKSDANFSQVMGINAQSKNKDDYSFVWSGDDTTTLGVNSYTSHGKGTFSLNPINGLSGIYIGEKTLADIIPNTNIYVNGKKTIDLEIINISNSDYYNLIVNNEVLSNAIYIVSSDTLNVYGEQIKNVANGTEDTDGVNLGQVNSLINDKTDEITTDINELIEQNNIIENNLVVLSGNVSNLTTKTNILTTDVSTAKTNISNLQTKTSTIEKNITDLKTTDDKLNQKLNNKVLINGLSVEQLEVKHISNADYNDLVVDDATLSNAIYIVSSDTLNMYGEQIKNLADGTEATDAVNLGQVSSSISTVEKTLDNKINQINSKISDYALSNDVKNITNTLANNIDNKVLIDSTSAEQFEIKHVSHEEYYELINNEQVLSNTLYLVSADIINAYNQRIENVADAIKDTDGVNLKQVKDLVKNETDRSILIENELDNKIVEVNSKLNNYALKTDIIEIENDLSNKIKVDGNNVDTLNIINISQSDYNDLVIAETVNKNALYIVSSDINNAYNEQIKNVADGIEDTDAANMRQLNYKLVDIELIDNGTNLSCKLENRTISKMTIDSDEKPIVIAFPNLKTGYARDFILQINVTLASTNNLQIEWEGLDDNWNAISDVDDWAVLAPGLNVISFTEMN